jgi:dCMP deaminase
MNPKLLRVRVQQCLTLATASECARAKFGAILVEPDRGVILADGYNGGPKGGSRLCAQAYDVDLCARTGLTSDDIEVRETSPRNYDVRLFGECASTYWEQDRAEQCRDELLKTYPPIESGTQVEVGCVHAEQNCICNAAANGVATKGAWLIVNGEPCRMCAKLIHHAGIAKVVLVAGGYQGHNGVVYLTQHGVAVMCYTDERTDT